MAPPNFGKDFLYNTKKLSVIFGISSLVLLAVIVALVIDDSTHEWKRYQREFNRMQLEQAQAELKAAEAKINPAESARIKEEMKQASRDLSSKKKELGEKLKLQKSISIRFQKASQEYQIQKANFEAVRYAYESSAASSEEHLVRMKSAREQKIKELKKSVEDWRAKVEKSKVHWRGLLRKPSLSVSHFVITAAVTICALACGRA